MESGKVALAQRKRIATLLIDGRSIIGKEGRRVPNEFNDKHVHYVWARSQGMTVSESASISKVSEAVALNLESSSAVDYARTQYRKERASEVQLIVHDRALAQIESILASMKPKDYARILKLDRNLDQSYPDANAHDIPNLPDQPSHPHDSPHAPTEDLQTTKEQINTEDTLQEPTELPDFLETLT
tara:strand:- start:5 stop:562 length:558 start_codon:yes stop_codon:yes gene_type:complete